MESSRSAMTLTRSEATSKQVPLIRQFASYQFRYNPMLAATLALEAAKSSPGQVVTSLSSFLTATRNPDSQTVARQQQPSLPPILRKQPGGPSFADFTRNMARGSKKWTTFYARCDNGGDSRASRVGRAAYGNQVFRRPKLLSSTLAAILQTPTASVSMPLPKRSKQGANHRAHHLFLR
jgi:hypothetical protein